MNDKKLMFIQKVSNCIDLDDNDDSHIQAKWESVSCDRMIDITEHCLDKEEFVPHNHHSQVLPAAAATTTSSHTSCASVNDAALVAYPVSWHISQPLMTAADRAKPGRTQLWHAYRHCQCDGTTRFFLKGDPYAAFAPSLIKARPPCCFTEATLKMKSPAQVTIIDQADNCLAICRPELPLTLHSDPLIRDPEEAMMIVLCENIWWLAQENCQMIKIQIDLAGYTPATRPYHTQLALPCLNGSEKTCLSDFCEKLNDVYRHLDIIIIG